MTGVPVKYPYVGSLRWALMRRADIESASIPGTVYLRRLRIVHTPWFALCLHWIYEPDDDRWPHDHPANFWTFILRGGYEERVFTRGWNGAVRVHSPSRMTWHRFSVHKMPVSKAHWITVLKPRTVTLVLFGRRQRNWGFWTHQGFVPYQEYKG